MSKLSDKKGLALHGVLLLALIAACLVSLLAGAAPLPAEDVWRSGIFQLRLARTVLCLVAGAGLSAAGVIFQAVLRNPLAEPYVVGVSWGAGLGAALAIVFGLSAAGVWTFPAAAFAGPRHDRARLRAGPHGCGNGPCPDSPPLRRGGKRHAGKRSYVRGVRRTFGKVARRRLVASGQPTGFRLGAVAHRLDCRFGRTCSQRAFLPET